MGQSTLALLFLLLVSGVHRASASANSYYGRLIGSLESDYHGIRGDIYAVDARTLFIKGFSYDGKGEDTLFYAGSSSKIGTDGFVVPNEDGSTESLSRAYEDQDLTLTLPEGKTIKEIRWLTVWSRTFSEAFGEVRIPAGFDYPRPQRLSALSGIHKVSSDRVYVVDAQTFLLPNFTYDGTAPDAFFWVGSGSKPGQQGDQVPDENGKMDPLRRYDTKTLVLTLPGDLTVFDVEWLSVWCKAYGIDFGHIRIPKNLNVPPSLKMLGVAPQAKLNCEVLWDDLALEVRWAVAGETIVLQLVGKIDDGQYVSFGPSGDFKKSRMIGSDVAVGWLDRSSGKGFVHDHFITSKGPCSAGKGVCQDTVSAQGSNNIRLLNAALVNDYVMLTYQRPLKAQDSQDKSIITNGTQAVIWAVGPLGSNNEPTYHKLRNKGDLLIDFGRSPFWNCPAPEDPSPSSTVPPVTSSRRPSTPDRRPVSVTEEIPWSQPNDPAGSKSVIKISPEPVSNKPPWYIPAIECHEPENHIFYVHLGPNGGTQGYNAITGQVGWGISWFINGLLIPEVTLVRGQTYTFVVEGGQDPDRPSRYHPFYITDDPEGGYEFKTPAERSKIQIFAGVTYDRDGNPAPSAQGRLCEWLEDPNQPADKFSSFGAYQRTLKLHCEEGEPAYLQFTPDEYTPDTIYYQGYTHRFLGWKIRVVDSCDVGNANRKIDSNGASKPSFNPSPKQPAFEIEARDDPDYYEDDIPINNQENTKKNAVPSKKVDMPAEHRSPDQNPFYPPNPFSSSFPSDFGEFFGGSPFGKKEEKQPQRPSQTASNKPYKVIPIPKTPELPPSIITAEEQQSNPNIPGPIKQLNKFINHASNFNQQLPSRNVQNDPPRNQVIKQRPGQPPRQQERLSQPSLPVQHELENHQQIPEESIPTRINPPPVQQRPFNPSASPSNQRPYHQSSDNLGGVFDPNTIILESGFKPIRTNEGPIPPLGFDVEPAHSEVKSFIDPETLATSEPPSLVTLEPVFVASEPDNRRVQEPVPITLPKAVVPVVPGAAAPVPKFAPLDEIANNPPFRGPPSSQRQPIRPQQKDPYSRPGPQRKKTGLASLFSFGSQRRRDPPPPIAQPVAFESSSPRNPFQLQSLQPPQGPQLLRQVGPSAGLHRLSEQLSTLQQEEQLNKNSNPASNRPLQQRQEEFLKNRNVHPGFNRPSGPQSKPQQRLTGLFQRFLGGDRRKENGPEIIFPTNIMSKIPARTPIAKSDFQNPPHITFQGPLPPIIATKVQSATKPVLDGLRRSDRPLGNPNVLDPFSASIIGGGPVLGLPNTPVKAVFSDAEKAKLERFLFGPAEHHTPRSFSSGSVISYNDEELSTNLPDESHNSEFISTEGAIGEESVTEQSPNEIVKESDSKRRQKRQGNEVDHQHDDQHLEQITKDIDSSRLPVEHRGLDEDEDEEHHDSSSSSRTTCGVSLTAALFLYMILSKLQH